MQSADDKIIKLQYSLIHWQKWEAEYEALRDEVRDLDECSAEELVSFLVICIIVLIITS